MLPSDTLPPDLYTLLDNFKAELLSIINCIGIGKITKITSGAQTVELQLQIRRVADDGSSSSYPILVDCPYFVLQGGGAYLDMPIKVGDIALVLFNDRNIDNWWSTGNESNPSNMRKHSLSDAIAIVGLNPSSSPLGMDGTWVRLLGTSGPGAEQPAAREGDEVQTTTITDPSNVAYLTIICQMFGLPFSSPLIGKISAGSSEVKIG